MVTFLDGREGGEYRGRAYGGPVFSPDSRWVAYRASRENREYVVVDSAWSSGYGGFVRGSTLTFTSPTTLQTLAVRGTKVLRVEFQIREGA